MVIGMGNLGYYLPDLIVLGQLCLYYFTIIKVKALQELKNITTLKTN